MRAAEIYELDSQQGRARRIGAALATGLTLDDMAAWPGLLQAVTPADVQAAARAVFRPEASVTGWLTAEDGDNEAPSPRALLACRALALPARAEIEIQAVTSPGGITAWLYEEHSMPILNIEASFRGGAALDPTGREGAASLMAALLGEGAGDARRHRLRRGARGAGGPARLQCAGCDSVDVSAQVLTENRDAAWSCCAAR